MPIPQPTTNESRDDFISRCARDETMLEDYPDNSQRIAVCATTFDNQKEVHMDQKNFKKTLDISTKVLDAEQRIIQFKASTSNYDRDEDRLMVTGWDLDNFMKNPVFLYMHDKKIPAIGRVVNHSIDANQGILYMDVQFPTIEEMTSSMDVISEHAKFVDMLYNMYKNGFMNAVSVGFLATEGAPNERGGYDFTKLELLELSAVTVPANQEALKIGAKSIGMKEADVNNIVIEFNKTLDSEEQKAMDTDGNISTWDIERILDNAIDKQGVGYYCLDQYPVNYPNGHCVITGKDGVKMFPYAISKNANGGYEVVFGEPKVLENIQAWVEKSAEKERIKAGAVLSSKNMSIISEVIESLSNGHDALKGLLDSATTSDENSQDDTIEKDLEEAEEKEQEESVEKDVDSVDNEPTEEDIDEAEHKHLESGGLVTIVFD